jgi:outer membrane murein-binding lipoprotein Lpp
MAEQEKSQIQTTIMNLTADCERLEDDVDQLNQDAVDIRKSDEDERKSAQADH